MCAEFSDDTVSQDEKYLFSRGFLRSSSANYVNLWLSLHNFNVNMKPFAIESLVYSVKLHRYELSYTSTANRLDKLGYSWTQKMQISYNIICSCEFEYFNYRRTVLIPRAKL